MCQINRPMASRTFVSLLIAYCLAPAIEGRAQTLFDSRPAWQAAAGQIDFLEDFSANTSSTTFGNTPETATPFGFFSIYGESGGSGVRVGGHPDTINGSPFAYLEAFAGPTRNAGLVFNEGIRAFGFDGGSLESSTEIVFTTSKGNSFTTTGSNFRGIVLDAPGEFLSGVTFQRQSGSDGFGLDNLAAVTSVAAQRWSAADDFSPSSNPNGAWAYGYQTSLGGAFSLYNVPTTLGTGLNYWTPGSLGVDPNLLHNPSASPVAAFDFIVQPGQAAFHPGPSGQFSVFRWIAPSDGLYSIQADFVGLGASSTTDVHVMVNGVPLFNQFINGQGTTAGFDIERPLVAEDTVDFAVGFGSNGNFVSDTTGINAIITAITEPTSFVWIGGGINSNFENASNWSPAGVPNSLNTATVTGPAEILGEGQPDVLNINGQLNTTSLTLTNSSIVNSGSIQASGANAFLRLVNSSINNTGGAIQATGAGAAIQIQPGTNVVGGTLSSADDAAIEVNGGSISADLVSTTSGGRIDLNSGLLRATTLTTDGLGTDDVDQQGGRLEVLNFDGNFQQNGGTYAPGHSTAISTLSGTYILGAGGTLEIELAGAALGNFDQLLIGQNVVLNGGELSVVALNGFQVAAGDSFGIMRVGGTLVGTFDGLAEGALVGNFGKDLFITYKAGDGNDIGLYNPLVLGSVNFADAGPDDDAFVVGNRAGSGGIPAPPVTITLESLTLLNGSSFTLDPNEILELNGGTLFIGQGAVFSGNGIIRGNVINAGLLRIPIVRVPTIPQVTGGYVEIEIPESDFPEIVIDLPDGGGGGFAVGINMMI